MPYNILVSPGAKQDIQQAFNYYESITPELGERFTNSVDERLQSLSITPRMAAIRYENIRCTLLKKFPYLIHYSVDDAAQAVIILRVFHTSRKPLWE